MKNFSIIVAADEKNGIGKNNDLAWKISADLKNFKKITTESENGKKNAVVMGRKTWESIPEKFKPLPGRKNFILTSQKNFLEGKKISDDIKIFGDFDNFLEKISQDKEIDKIFVIGGGQIYKSTIFHKNCEKIFLTKVFGDFGCEKFFPEIPEIFEKKNESEIFEENGVRFQFLELSK